MAKRKKKNNINIKVEPDNPIIIHADGSCLKNRAGGWGVLIKDTEGKMSALSGGAYDTTSPAMEVKAVTEALSCIKEPSDIKVFTDCEYVVKGINIWLDNWEKNNFKNYQNRLIAHDDNWRKISKSRKFHKSVTCVHVTAHDKHITPNENFIVDILAKDEALAINK